MRKKNIDTKCIVHNYNKPYFLTTPCNEYAVYNLKMAEKIFKEVENAKVWCYGGSEYGTDCILGMATNYEMAQKIYRR